MEGNTYPVRWKKQGEKYLVYLDSEKTINGIDVNFEIACEELCLAICDKYGDGGAILNYLREPPQPSGISKYSNPALVTLGWNESVDGKHWQVGLFEGGYCKACKAGIGRRTSTPLEVESVPKGEIGSFNQIMFSPVLLSENFLSLFTEIEKAQMGLLPVRSRKKGSRKFYEVSGEPALKQVGVKAGVYNSLISWECGSCGQQSFSCSHPEMPDNYKYTDFVCSSDLPNDTNQAFIIKDKIGRKMICMSLYRWRQLNNHKYSKGVLADRVYVLPEEQIDRNPTVRKEVHENKGI